MTNKKIIILTFIMILIVGIVIFIENNKKEKISDIEQIIKSYPNFTFENINYDNNFIQTSYQIRYTYSNTNVKMNINGQNLIVSVVNGQLHFLYNNIDHINNEITDAIKIMEYKSCNCNEECKYIVILTNSGYVYYANIYNSINDLDNISLTKLDVNELVLDLGYVDNLDKISECGVNGIGLKTKIDEIIIDDEFKNFIQEYYRSIGSLYIYTDGLMKDKDLNNLNQKIILIFMIDDSYYFIAKNGILYTMDSNLLKKQLSEKKVVKIGYREKNDILEIILIFEDATAKKFEIKNDLIIR